MPFKVVICGGGVAGLEGLLRLRKLAGSAIEITLLVAREEFHYRPMAVREAFGDEPAKRYPLAQFVADMNASWIRHDLSWIDWPNRQLHTLGSETLDYDAVLVAVGGRERKPPQHVQIFNGRNAREVYHGVLSEIMSNNTYHLALVMPDGPTWPLPLYELALLTAARIGDRGGRRISFITPEKFPLQSFGEQAGIVMTKLLSDAGVELTITDGVIIPGPRQVILSDGSELHPDRIVSLPVITGPNVRGLGGEGRDRFVPIDDRCRVLGTDGHVFAAGDATDQRVKHGSIGAQQADVAAAGIANLAGRADPPAAVRPEVHALIFTGADPLYLTAHVVAGQGWRGEIYDRPPWPVEGKVVAAELGPYLDGLANRTGSPS